MLNIINNKTVTLGHNT